MGCILFEGSGLRDIRSLLKPQTNNEEKDFHRRLKLVFLCDRWEARMGNVALGKSVIQSNTRSLQISKAREAERVVLPPFRSIEEFYSKATFTESHNPQDGTNKFGIRAWRNFNHFQSNYVSLLGIAVLVSLSFLWKNIHLMLFIYIAHAVVFGRKQGSVADSITAQRRALHYYICSVSMYTGPFGPTGDPDESASVVGAIFAALVSLAIFGYLNHSAICTICAAAVIVYASCCRPSLRSKVNQAASIISARESTTSPFLAFACIVSDWFYSTKDESVGTRKRTKLREE